jgi:hypothetical protein
VVEVTSVDQSVDYADSLIVPVISPTLSYRVGKWVRSIPTLLDENGGAFPTEHVYLYALRHSYTQRHADAGCRWTRCRS